MRHIPSHRFALAAALVLQSCANEWAPTALAGSGALAASVTPADPEGRHLVVFTAERVPADFGERAARLGGSVEATVDSIGVSVVTGLSESAATELASAAGIRAVEPDLATALRDENAEADDAADEAASEALAPADATGSPTAAQFYPRQWNLRAGFADQAWAAGHLGS